MRLRIWCTENVTLVVVTLAIGFGFLPPAAGGQWQEHQRKLNDSLNKYRAKREEFKKLVAEKTSLKDPVKLEENLKKIVETHRLAEEFLSNYKEERRHVQYKHPDKAKELDQKGIPEEMEQLSEIETTMGLPGRLEAIRRKIESAYGPFPPRRNAVGGGVPRRSTTTTTIDERPRLKM